MLQGAINSNGVELAIAEGEAAGVAADEKRIGKPPRPLSREAEKAMRRIEPEDDGGGKRRASPMTSKPTPQATSNILLLPDICSASQVSRL